MGMPQIMKSNALYTGDLPPPEKKESSYNVPSFQRKPHAWVSGMKYGGPFYSGC